MNRIELTDAEVERLVEILDRGFSPTPALRKALLRLSDPKRQPPEIRWPGEQRPQSRNPPIPQAPLLEILSTWPPLDEELPDIEELGPIKDVDL